MPALRKYIPPVWEWGERGERESSREEESFLNVLLSACKESIAIKIQAERQRQHKFDFLHKHNSRPWRARLSRPSENTFLPLRSSDEK